MTRVFNGIVATSRFLLVVDTATGDLVRVDLASGAVRQVSLHGGDLAHGDGLELVRGTLWAAHSTTDTISRWHLSADDCAARLERSVTDTALQIPTGHARDAVQRGAGGRNLSVRHVRDVALLQPLRR